MPPAAPAGGDKEAIGQAQLTGLWSNGASRGISGLNDRPFKAALVKLIDRLGSPATCSAAQARHSYR